MMSDVWNCCGCGGQSLVELAQVCPLCGHIPCGYCMIFSLPPQDEYLPHRSEPAASVIGPQDSTPDNSPPLSRIAINVGQGTPTSHSQDTPPRARNSPTELWDGSTCSSRPASISSMATGFSATTAGTQYSEMDVISATHQLVHLLSQHLSLSSLIEEAAKNPAIGTDRFCNNFRRLLKIYSKDLEEEAGEHLEFHVAKLVRLRARTVAHLVLERLELSNTRPKCQGSQNESHLEDDSDEEDRIAIREDGIETLAPVQGFLLETPAFEKLKANLEKFVKPRVQTQPEVEVLDNLENLVSSPPTFSQFRVRMGIIPAFLVRLGIAQRPLEPGMERVKWTCRCGKQLYDDYLEIKPGALRTLQQRLDRFSQSATISSTNGHTASSPTSSTTGWSWTPLRWIKDVTESIRSSQENPSIPLHNKTAVGACQSSSRSNLPQETLHLLICMRDGKYSTGLYQKIICGLKNDHQLFQFLHDEYHSRRGKLSSWTSLRAPEAINLVKFRIAFGRYVEVFKHEFNCTSSASCPCLPPPDRVEPNQNADYRCEPIPAGLCPPIGPNVLVHCFNNPDCLQDYETQSWILAQIPKKLHGELKGTPAGPVHGWGIHFQEGWDWDQVGWLLVAYMLGSLAFGIAWWMAKDDIQGGSGVAGYLVATATVFMGWIAMRHR